MMSLTITKFRKYSTIIIFCIFCIIGTVLKAAETPQTSLLALSKGEQSLSIVDPATLTLVARVPAGPDPHEVIASADGKFAFVSNYGGGSYNTVTVVDLLAQKALSIIDLGALRGPHGLAFVGGKLWFTAEGSKAVGSYDPATKQIDLILGTGQDCTHMIYGVPNLNPIVTSNVNSATVTVIEKADSSAGPPLPPGAPPRAAPRTNWTETVIPVGKGSEGFDVSPDGKEIWVANAGDGTVSIIDVASKTVTQTLAADVAGANRLKFTPDGKLALISTLRGSNLTVIDRATRKT